MTETPAGLPGVDFPAPEYPGITYVIPCGGGKLDRAAPARDLYTGQMFRHTLTNAERLAACDVAEGRGPARVLILSALYGLVELGTVLEPYDLKMGKPGSVTAEQLAEQALRLGIDWGSQVYALLPRAYLARLDEALRSLYVYVQDVYEGTGGILQQKRVNVHVGRTGPAPAAEPSGPGPRVWLGADVNGLWWGIPVLVSYGRLREARELPVASAPWVCDSRGFAEVAEHGRWTISAEQYVADLRRYAAEIGQLVWAAPQDWPAGTKMLARTGLSEAEHQARTVASVVQLRALAPELDIICVLTGETAAGYLRHKAMYAAAGIDVHAETLPVGVGALVGRSPTEAADIIRTLYASGLRNMHGFGVKTRVLDRVGAMLAWVDSAGWSNEARRRAGRCPHGLVEWERNCPVAAQTWGDRQQTRAAVAPVQEALPIFALMGDTPDGPRPQRLTR